MIPPEADAELMAGMEDGLETYERAYDPQRPGAGRCPRAEAPFDRR